MCLFNCIQILYSFISMKSPTGLNSDFKRNTYLKPKNTSCDNNN